MLNKIKSRVYNLYALADLAEEKGDALLAEQIRIDSKAIETNVNSIDKILSSFLGKLDEKPTKKTKKKAKYTVTKKRKLITEPEVKEIEEYLDRCRDLNVKPDYKYICKKYEISDTIFYKIENHTHRYSTIKEI